MPKFYIFSDCHGFYKELREALDEAGFDKSNPDHWLISLGDEMDRGHDPEKVINYLMGLPRAIWVKGNHQELMEELLERGYPLRYDWSNGTMGSVIDLDLNAKTIDQAFATAYMKTKPFFNRAINYLETENYIFVHSFIPLKCNDDLPKYYIKNRKFEYNPDWRFANESEWSQSRWGNPFDLAMNGFNQTEKTIVHGHWSNSFYWAKEYGLSEFDNDACFDICYHNKCIGLDATTVLTHKINVLVIEDNFIVKER